MRPSADYPGMFKVVFAASILARSAAARNVNCKDILASGIQWNFAELDGVHHLRYHEYDFRQSFISNYTFGFNICGNLPKDDEVHGCRAGTRVCGARNVVDKDLKLIAGGGETEYFEITGNYQTVTMDAKYTSLKSISDNEGVRIEAYGGSRNKQNKIRIDFICPTKKEKRTGERDDKDEDGDDEDGKPDGNSDFYDKHRDLRKELVTDDGKDGKITLIKWGEVADDDPEKKGQVDKLLALEWETKYACESAIDDPDLERGSSGGWGFFSWFFFLSFLGLLAYFCFFAWINYTRFGKSGFDMLPHADTLRELPQLLSEYARKVVNTLRGGHSSGGYSAL